MAQLVVGSARAFTLERLTPDDAPRFRQIRLRTLQDAPQMFHSTAEEAAALPAEEWRRQLEALATFVAVRDGMDIGVVRAAGLDIRPGAALLRSMWVAPSARGEGVGEALIDVVLRWARLEGLSRILLLVADHNEHAIALYARKGFAPLDDEHLPSRAHEHYRVLDFDA